MTTLNLSIDCVILGFDDDQKLKVLLIKKFINNKNDFVMDFFDIDTIFNKTVFDKLDHKYLNDIDGLQSPTTENLAKWIWNTLIKQLSILKEVHVFENDVYGCIYKGD